MLHRAEALTGDRIAAENYFEPAERYLRSMGENLNEEPQRQPFSENFSDLAQPEALDLTGSGWADLPGIRSSVRRPFTKVVLCPSRFLSRPRNGS